MLIFSITEKHLKKRPQAESSLCGPLPPEPPLELELKLAVAALGLMPCSSS